MTIAALLSAHGIRASRYVTADGRTIFDNVTATLNGFIHPVHGSVTKVAPHTFHDGPAPTDDAAEDWWHDPALVAPHVAAMGRAFPSFRFIPAEGGKAPTWTGTLNTGRGRFEVDVTLRHDRGLPFVRILNRKRLGKHAGRHFRRPPHIYLSGAPCIADQSDWDPAEHTAATATAWLAHWLAAYTEWLFFDRWPVDGDSSAA